MLKAVSEFDPAAPQPTVEFTPAQPDTLSPLDWREADLELLPGKLKEKYTVVTDHIDRLHPEERDLIQSDLSDIITFLQPTHASEGIPHPSLDFAKEWTLSRLLSDLADGLTYGNRAMDILGGSAVSYSEHLYEEHVVKDKSIEDIGNLLEGPITFNNDLHDAFDHSFLRAIPVFAQPLRQENLDGVTQLIFEKSDKYIREIGYTGEDGLYRAVYALDLTTEALRRIAAVGRATKQEEVNPGLSSTSPSYVYTFDSGAAKYEPVQLFIREQHGNERVLGEYGNRDGVQASMSFLVDLHDMDRREAEGLAPQPSEQLGSAYKLRKDHIIEIPDKIDFTRRTRRDVLRYLAQDFENRSMGQVSIRIDFEGDYPERRGVSLDIGSILSDAHGLSYVVGNLFASGDVLIARRLHRETMLNHNPRFTQEEVGNSQTFRFLTRAVTWAITKGEHLRRVPVRERYCKKDDTAVHGLSSAARRRTRRA